MKWFNRSKEDAENKKNLSDQDMTREVQIKYGKYQVRGSIVTGLVDQYGQAWEFKVLPGGKVVLHGVEGQLHQVGGNTVSGEQSKVFYSNTQGLPSYLDANSVVLDKDGNIIQATWDE